MECGAGCRGGQQVDAGCVVSSVAQQRWSETPIAKRLKILKGARHRMAAMPEQFAAAISPALSRTAADTLVAELMPLLDACRFLEREAATILQARVLGSAGRPMWLRGVEAEIRRDAVGHVLVIGPSNFPLFLPGVQVLQALAAGNRVTWKPGAGGREVAELVAGALTEAGLPHGLLKVTGDTIDAAYEALAEKPDKVVFTRLRGSGQGCALQACRECNAGGDGVVGSGCGDRASGCRFGTRGEGGGVRIEVEWSGGLYVAATAAGDWRYDDGAASSAGARAGGSAGRRIAGTGLELCCAGC